MHIIIQTIHQGTKKRMNTKSMGKQSEKQSLITRQGRILKTTARRTPCVSITTGPNTVKEARRY